MASVDIDALVEKMLKAVRQYVSTVRTTLDARIDELRAHVDALPRGEKGDPGKDAVLPDLVALVRPIIDEAVAALPKPKDGDPGKDAVLPDLVALVRPIIDEAVAALPKPRDGLDGKDAVLPDLVALVRPIIDEAVAALPKPKDGKDAALPDIEGMVAAAVLAAVAKIPAAKDGKDGNDGKDVDMRAVGELIDRLVDHTVSAYVAKLPQPKDGTDGKDADMAAVGRIVTKLVDETVHAAVAALPKPEDGAPGRDAAELAILPSIDEAKSYRRGTWASYRGGLIRALRDTAPLSTALQGVTSAGWEVMVEGLAGVAAEPGASAREYTIKLEMTGGTVKSFTAHVPAMEYRGVWADGQKYERGDVVTWGGSAWHCQEATNDKPGVSQMWKLMVKHGAPGRDADRPDKKPEHLVVRTK